MFRIQVITCLTGCILAVSGLLYKSVKTSMDVKDVASEGSIGILFYIDWILNRKFISIVMNHIVKDRGFFINRYLSKILELSEAGINLKQFYFIKLSVLIVSAALFAAVMSSNINYHTRRIIETLEIETIWAAIGTSPLNKPDYKLYKHIYNKLDSKSLWRKNYQEQHYIVEEVVTKIFNTSDSKEIDEKTKWFLDIFTKTQSIENKYMDYALGILISFCLPDLFLLVKWLIIGAIYKREVIKLEYVFELLAKVDGMKTIDIVRQLEKSSKIYSRYFQEFLQIFSFDKRRAFALLKDKNIKSLANLSGILEIYSMTDKEIAMQILEREIIERDEAVLMTADETVDLIDIIAFLSIVPIVYELAGLMLKPMLDMVYRAFELV